MKLARPTATRIYGGPYKLDMRTYNNLTVKSDPADEKTPDIVVTCRRSGQYGLGYIFIKQGAHTVRVPIPEIDNLVVAMDNAATDSMRAEWDCEKEDVAI